MSCKENIYTQVKAFISLFWIGSFLDDLVEVDFQEELSSNEQLASSNDQSKDKVRRELRDSTIERANLLRKRLVSSLLWILSACFVAFILVKSISRNICFASFLTRHSDLAFLSIISFSWATLGRLGWEGQTMAGDTVFEQLDKSIFWLLYWLGTLFGTLAFLI
jgi:hypothetical protein